MILSVKPKSNSVCWSVWCLLSIWTTANWFLNRRCVTQTKKKVEQSGSDCFALCRAQLTRLICVWSSNKSENGQWSAVLQSSAFDYWCTRKQVCFKKFYLNCASLKNWFWFLAVYELLHIRTEFSKLLQKNFKHSTNPNLDTKNACFHFVFRFVALQS